MSTDNTFKPANAEIQKASIKSFGKSAEKDIASLIHNITFSQSTEDVVWRGMISLYDTVGLLESYPLRGEEELHLILKGMDLKTVVDLKCQIYKIDNVVTTPSSDGVTYDLHVISKISYEASKRKIIESHQDVAGAMIVKKMFKKYYKQLTELKSDALPYGAERYGIAGNKKLTFTVQPTTGKLKAVIPHMMPSNAMDFMANRCYSTQTPSSSYSFFETFSGYHFVTDEFLIKQGIDDKSKLVVLNNDAFNNLEPSNAIGQIQTIESISSPNRIDTAADMLSGGYRNTMFEIDLIRKKVSCKEFDYSKGNRMVNMNGKEGLRRSDAIHTDAFAAETFTRENAKRYLVFRDYTGHDDLESTLRADQYYSEIIANKSFHKRHMNGNSVTVGLKGRLDIQPGMLVKININVNSGNSNKKANEQASGNYLVRATVHTINKGVVYTKLNLVKYDWSV